MCYFFTTLAFLWGTGEFCPESYPQILVPVDSSQCPSLVGGLGQMSKPIQMWYARLQKASGWDCSLPEAWWHLGHHFWWGDMMQASLCLVSGLFFWLTSVFCLCKDCFGTQKKSLPGKDQIPFHFDLLSELFLNIEHNGHVSFGT